MTSPWVTSVPLGVFWCGYLYMPPVLYLYITHMHHSPIKYCQPYLMASTGLCCTVYCLATPLIHILGSTWPSPLFIMCGYVVPIYACTSYVLSAAAMVVMFKITDLVVNHSHFTPRHVNQLAFYRWLLYPKVQLPSMGCIGFVSTLPCLVAVVISADLTTLEMQQSSYNSILWISMAAVAILGSVVGIGLSKHMPPYMDNLGLRRTYQRTYRTSIVFVLVSLLHGGLEWILSVPLGREFHVRNLIYTLAMQYVFFFNIAAPLRHLALSSQAMTSVVTTTSKAASRMKELEQYLRSNHGLPTFMTFCQRDFRTEELRAWQLVEQFKQRLVSARKLLTTCLVPQCALACPTSVKWGPTYVTRLESWLRRDEDIVG
ncbi:hypothetical protein AaE_004210, partial [Aphanomyces astaci]